MVKRKHQLLTENERDHLLAIPSDRDDLARLYTFEPSDIEIIGARRERRNQIGVALQLALLRHPSVTLAQLMRDRGAIPHDLAAFVAEQLGLRVTDLADYAARPNNQQPRSWNSRSTLIYVGRPAPIFPS